MFYKGSLDKLGIEADVIQVGPKSRAHPTSTPRPTMGDGQREVINAILDEYYSRLFKCDSLHRGRSQQQMSPPSSITRRTTPRRQRPGTDRRRNLYRSVYEALKTQLGYKADDELGRSLAGNIARPFGFAWPQQWRTRRSDLRLRRDQRRPFEQQSVWRRDGRFGHGRKGDQ